MVSTRSKTQEASGVGNLRRVDYSEDKYEEFFQEESDSDDDQPQFELQLDDYQNGNPHLPATQSEVNSRPGMSFVAPHELKADPSGSAKRDGLQSASVAGGSVDFPYQVTPQNFQQHSMFGLEGFQLAGETVQGSNWDSPIAFRNPAIETGKFLDNEQNDAHQEDFSQSAFLADKSSSTDLNFSTANPHNSHPNEFDNFFLSSADKNCGPNSTNWANLETGTATARLEGALMSSNRMNSQNTGHQPNGRSGRDENDDWNNFANTPNNQMGFSNPDWMDVDFSQFLEGDLGKVSPKPEPFLGLDQPAFNQPPSPDFWQSAAPSEVSFGNAVPAPLGGQSSFPAFDQNAHQSNTFETTSLSSPGSNQYYTPMRASSSLTRNGATSSNNNALQNSPSIRANSGFAPDIPGFIYNNEGYSMPSTHNQGYSMPTQGQDFSSPTHGQGFATPTPSQALPYLNTPSSKRVKFNYKIVSNRGSSKAKSSSSQTPATPAYDEGRLQASLAKYQQRTPATPSNTQNTHSAMPVRPQQPGHQPTMVKATVPPAGATMTQAGPLSQPRKSIVYLVPSLFEEPLKSHVDNVMNEETSTPKPASYRATIMQFFLALELAQLGVKGPFIVEEDKLISINYRLPVVQRVQTIGWWNDDGPVGPGWYLGGHRVALYKDIGGLDMMAMLREHVENVSKAASQSNAQGAGAMGGPAYPGSPPPSA